MMISPWAFFIFLILPLFGLLGGWVGVKGQKMSQDDKIVIYGTLVWTDDISRVFIHFFKIFILWVVKGMVKRAEPCKCDILVSRILWHSRIIPSEWMFWYLIFTWWLSAVISPCKFMQRHFSEGCLFSLEKTYDVEC